MRRIISNTATAVCFALLLVSTHCRVIMAQERTDVSASLKIPDADNLQIITTEDGSTYIGRITQIETTTIQFETTVGNLTIPISSIKSFREVPSSTIRDGRYWFPNPNATRLFFTTTGRMLEKGKGYFSDIYIFFPSVNYGVTDRFSMGVGMSIFPGVKLVDQMFMFIPKMRIATSDNFNAAAGALIVRQRESSSSVGILYGVTTFGQSDNNLTVGLGYGFAGSDIAENPVLIVGGQARVGRKLALVTENWFIPGLERPLLSYGGRFMGETISVDLAFVTTFNADTLFPGIPFVDFVVNF